MMKVPHKRQPASEPWCGPVSGAMVAAYYGERISVARAVSEYQMKRDGVFIDQIASFFLKRGYKTSITIWPRGMEPRFRGLGTDVQPEKVAHALGVMARKKKKSRARDYARRLPRHIAEGGEVILDVPSAVDIRNELSHKRPVIINMDPRTLHRKGRAQGGHYMVGVGYMKDYLFVNDPAERKYPNRYFSEELMASCVLHTASVLFIRPPKQK